MAEGIEFGDLNWVALGLGMLASIVLGFLWYSKSTPTGKIWMRGMKMSPDFKPDPKKMTVSMVLMVVGTFLFMFVLMHVFLAFRDAYRFDGARLGDDGITFVDGLMGGFFTWLGFFLPVNFGLVAWEDKPWSFFFVVTSYYLVQLLAVGAIFASMM